MAATSAASGSVAVNVLADTRFTLTATNGRGATTSAVEIFVNPTPLAPRI